MKYLIKEAYSRLIQILFGAECFSFPGFRQLRSLMYKTAFNIGKGGNIEENVRFIRNHRQENSKFKVGANVDFARNAFVDATGDVEIGNNVMISSGAQIHTHIHPLEIGMNEPGNKKTVKASIKIEDGAWIGSQAIILPKVKRIGKNSVIGAGSVVTKEVPDFAIVAGNPAKIIGCVGNNDD